jgi:hypothetical protein
MKKILLVFPPVKGYLYLPTSLQKIATYHLQKGDKVIYKNSNPSPKIIKTKFYPDIIYVSSVFTYYGRETCNTINLYKKQYPDSEIKVGGIFPTLMPDYVEQRTGIKPHLGTWDEIDKLSLNYSLFPDTMQAQVITTRGCIRKCKFCAVKTLEPKFKILEGWKSEFLEIPKKIKNFSKKNFRVLISDNNFLASPFDHQTEVINLAAKLKFDLIFQQALDFRLFNKNEAKLLSKLGKTSVIIFAYDGPQQNEYFQKGMKLVRKYKLAQHTRLYMLYNFEDKPECIWNRMQVVMNEKSRIFMLPIRFEPLDTLTRNNYVNKYWTASMLKNFKAIISHWAYSPKGSLVRNNIPKDAFGRNADEFYELLNTPFQDHKIFKMYKDSERVRKSGFNFYQKEKGENYAKE